MKGLLDETQSAVGSFAGMVPTDLPCRNYPSLGQRLVYSREWLRAHGTLTSPSILVANQALPAPEAWLILALDQPL